MRSSLPSTLPPRTPTTSLSKCWPPTTGSLFAAYDVFGADGGGLAGSVDDGSNRADGLTHTESSFLLLNSGSLEEAAGLWDKLSPGGTIIQALAPADWAPAYGMLTDRFGITWIFGIVPNS